MTPITIEILAQVQDALAGLGQVSSSMGGMQHANQDAAGALNTFGINLASLDNPLTLVAGGIKDSIQSTLAWGQSIEKLSAESGQTTEQASRMAVVFGDFGINVDGLDRVVKQFTKNGLEFNLQTIQQLAAQYQAITDPVQRNEFAFKNFGRSAMEMNEILTASPAKLQGLADAAQTSGKVISEYDVKAMEDFRLKTAQLEAQMDGLKLGIGIPLIGGLSNAVDGFNGLGRTVNAVGLALQAHLGIITWDQAALGAHALAAAADAAALQSATPAVQANTAATADNAAAAALDQQTLAGLVDTRREDIQAHAADLAAAQAWVAGQADVAKANEAERVAAANAVTANEGLAQSYLHLTNADLARTALQELNKALAAGTITIPEYNKQTTAIGEKYGLVSAQSVAAAGTMSMLNDMLDKKKISPEQYAAALDKVKDATKTGLIPSLQDLGIDLGRHQSSVDIVRAANENWYKSLGVTYGAALPQTKTATENLTGSVGLGQTAIQDLISLGLVPANSSLNDLSKTSNTTAVPAVDTLGSHIGKMKDDYISPASLAVRELVGDLSQIPPSKTCVVTVITKYVTQGTPP